jgi:hypothetical protein
MAQFDGPIFTRYQKDASPEHRKAEESDIFTSRQVAGSLGLKTIMDGQLLIYQWISPLPHR